MINFDGKKILATLTELVIPLVCILVSVGFILFLIVPGVGTIKNRREVKARKEEELERLREKSRKLDTFSSQIRDLEKNLSLATKALPDEDKIPELMTQLQIMAAESGVSVSSLQYSGGSRKGKGEEKGVENVQLKMGVEGEYQGIKRLFELIEEASRVVLLDQFSLLARRESSMSANLMLSSFYLAPPDRVEVEAPISLSLSAPDFQAVMRRIEALKVYETEVDVGLVGKEDPFSE